ncbi:YHS domain-containing (seleno)protein [Mucilaginibacter gotjawali]|uniref:YHS domain-containing protein n=1 Tax=Mucilaginibacter gotjawali TaxID=1550579 RepID=A0A839SAC6_9SPHI|nr:YHS domain-containing (seleno)protein [Mucilaginibacter gotjawali]MBB3054312.1 YHS domain-containing protein [Mucilaginibacter gotjawali]
MKKTFTLILISVFTAGFVSAQNPTELHKKHYNLDKNGLAIQGYDPVSYFTGKKAQEGKKDITLTTEGITYRFATTQDRDLFKSSPAKYQPQFGGWCAYAMGATGEKVDIDPGTFKLIDGKLYLFYNAFFNNTKKSWDKDENNLKAKADANWAKIIQ